MHRPVVFALSLALGLVGGIEGARAANLVVNGDFETGSLNPWVGVNSVVIDSAFPHGGSFDASLSTVASVPATLSQSIATVIGNVYRLSFFVLDETPSLFNTLTVTFGGFSTTITGDTAFDVTQTNNYAFETFLLPSADVTSSTTTLGIAAVNDIGAFNLDDVVVVSVPVGIPEPPSWSLAWLPLLIGLGTVRTFGRRTG